MKTLKLKSDNWIICPDIEDVKRVEKIFKDKGFQANAREINHAIQLWRFSHGSLNVELPHEDRQVFLCIKRYFE